MLAHRGRNVLLAAVLATAVAAPAVANDAVTTAQQTAVGQGTAEMAPVQNNSRHSPLVRSFPPVGTRRGSGPPAPQSLD